MRNFATVLIFIFEFANSILDVIYNISHFSFIEISEENNDDKQGTIHQ